MWDYWRIILKNKFIIIQDFLYFLWIFFNFHYRIIVHKIMNVIKWLKLLHSSILDLLLYLLIVIILQTITRHLLYQCSPPFITCWKLFKSILLCRNISFMISKFLGSTNSLIIYGNCFRYRVSVFLKRFLLALSILSLYRVFNATWSIPIKVIWEWW